MGIFLIENSKIYKPTANIKISCNNPTRLQLLTRLRFWLSPIRQHKFKHSFQNTLTYFNSYGKNGRNHFQFFPYKSLLLWR